MEQSRKTKDVSLKKKKKTIKTDEHGEKKRRKA